YDATPEARTAIANGDMYGDAIQSPKTIGATTIDTIHDYFDGKTPPPIVKIQVGAFTKADAKKAK
ncbi:MAG: sugar ABC transporter substrate-binding protein, partial [Candidatus Eremiobacteraeota bacterium]|nr:sugar ABC transporter substrate-binding protein [Candidatus Eremiobacteraeota bacterium]